MSARGLNRPKYVLSADGGLAAPPFSPPIAPPKWLGCILRTRAGNVRKFSVRRQATTC